MGGRQRGAGSGVGLGVGLGVREEKTSPGEDTGPPVALRWS